MRCKLFGITGELIADWEGRWAPASLSAFPNRNVTVAYQLIVDEREPIYLPAGPLSDVVNATLHGARFQWIRNPWDEPGNSIYVRDPRHLREDIGA